MMVNILFLNKYTDLRKSKHDFMVGRGRLKKRDFTGLRVTMFYHQLENHNTTNPKQIKARILYNWVSTLVYNTSNHWDPDCLKLNIQSVHLWEVNVKVKIWGKFVVV